MLEFLLSVGYVTLAAGFISCVMLYFLVPRIVNSLLNIGVESEDNES